MMSLKDALAKARESRPEPILIPVAVGDGLYQIDVMRLDGMDWAAVMAAAPPMDDIGVKLSYDTSRGALVACARHSRLLDMDGDPVVEYDDNGAVIPTDWVGLFGVISGSEATRIAATWWALNMNDPNKHVEALKKASAGGGKTS